MLYMFMCWFVCLCLLIHELVILPVVLSNEFLCLFGDRCALKLRAAVFGRHNVIFFFLVLAYISMDFATDVWILFGSYFRWLYPFTFDFKTYRGFTSNELF